MQYFKLPDVLGEVALGFIVGPTILGSWALYDLSDGGHPKSILTSLFGIPTSQLEPSGLIFSFVADFAVLLLLFKVGMEIDFDVLKRVKKPALSSAIGGIAVPLLFGLTFLAITMQIAPDLVIPEDSSFTEVGLFLAVALTATSIGISTRIFLDLKKIKTRAAQTVVGAAVFDDVVSVTLLALSVAYVSGLFTGSGVFRIFAEIALFFLISFILFKYFIPWFIRHTRVVQDRSFAIFFSIGFMLLMSVLAQTLELAPIIGAFTAGVIIGNEEDFLDLHTEVEPLADWIIPFFFISIGLGINLRAILTPTVIALGLTLATVAILAKFLGGTLGSKLSGNNWDTSRVVGLSMAAKGEVTLIFASEAYALGIFTLPLYAAVISLVMIDSLVIPTLLKFGIQYWLEDEEEEGNQIIVNDAASATDEEKIEVIAK
jgi:Kef-type K+ transport system membrane component KefB